MADLQSFLAVRVMECTGLQRADDSTSKVDPYVLVTIKYGNEVQKEKTTAKPHTNDPFYNETFYFNYDQLKKQKTFRVQIDVYSRNWRSNNDCLGNCVIEISRVPGQGEEIQDWFPLKKADTITGKILVVIGKTNSRIPPRLLWDGAVKNVEKTFRKDNLNIFCTTFNAGNIDPPGNLDDWFTDIPKGKFRDHDADLVVLGCQECEWGSRVNCEQIWKKLLDGYLGEAFEHVAHLSLQEIRIYIYVKAKYAGHISRICKSTEATGLAHIYGNKGGVGISFDFLGTSLCFVNAHLAAHQDKKERRDEDYSEIVQNLKLGLGKQEILAEFHYVFWMGDLNYRVDFGNQTEKTPSEDVFEVMTRLIDEDRYQVLKGYDQLHNSLRGQASFLKFNEGEINFQPTFKVERKQLFTYKKQRSPAWCDRVLWHINGEYEVKCLEYDCFPKIVVSDHKPVAALLAVPVWHPFPGVSNVPVHASMRFRGVSAVNLIAADMMTNLSDPYIHFPRQPLLETFEQSDFVAKTINPVFKDKQLPKLTFIRTNEHYIQHALLRFQIRDYDRFNPDDTIGYGVFTFSEFLKNRGDWVPFQIQLILTGKPAGTLTGEGMLTIDSLNK